MARLFITTLSRLIKHMRFWSSSNPRLITVRQAFIQLVNQGTIIIHTTNRWHLQYHKHYHLYWNSYYMFSRVIFWLNWNFSCSWFESIAMWVSNFSREILIICHEQLLVFMLRTVQCHIMSYMYCIRTIWYDAVM